MSSNDAKAQQKGAEYYVGHTAGSSSQNEGRVLLICSKTYRTCQYGNDIAELCCSISWCCLVQSQRIAHVLLAAAGCNAP
jgi:hypothetical protein